jgi:uncharacterized protein YkvS
MVMAITDKLREAVDISVEMTGHAAAVYEYAKALKAFLKKVNDDSVRDIVDNFEHLILKSKELSREVKSIKFQLGEITSSKVTTSTETGPDEFVPKKASTEV